MKKVNLPPRQYPLPLPHEERLTAEDFMITEGNAEAAAWVEKQAEWPSPCLVIYGPQGVGKTHLATLWQRHTEALPLTLDNLVNNQRGEENFVLFDNAEIIAGVKLAEEKLFHLFNALKEQKGKLLLTAAKPPSQWNIQLPDLRSRLVASLTIEISAPDDALLSAMMIKQFADRQLQVEEGVLDYLLPRLERSAKAVRDCVNRLDQASLAHRRGITTALAREVLEQIIAAD